FPLHVEVSTTSAALAVIQNNSNGYAMLVRAANDNAPAILLNNAANSASRHIFYGSGDAYFALGGGNVGVGTSGPTAKFNSVSALSSGGTVYSVSSPPPAAIRGDATSSSNQATGVFGTSQSVFGFGVVGQNTGTGLGAGIG